VSVDTYLKRKDLSSYQNADYEGVTILVSRKLTASARGLEIGSSRFLFWRGFEVDAAPLQQHLHGAA
jgi:hypothetical protein